MIKDYLNDSDFAGNETIDNAMLHANKVIKEGSMEEKMTLGEIAEQAGD